MEVLKHTQISQDYFYKKKVVIYQNKKGYRFSVDAPILADFLHLRPKEEALEVGTGCGIISILTLYKKKFSRIVALEVQDSLTQLARMNIMKNRFSQRVTIIHSDFCTCYKDYKGIKTIFSNPPYFKLNIGHLSPNLEIRDAKSETRLTLRRLIKYSAYILEKQGNLFLILPVTRSQELLKLAKEYNLYIRRIRQVFSFKDSKPERFLVQLTNNSVSMEEMTPLVIFKEKGIYTDEMNRILTG
jgi:tRNA1(Val) A37 N6-methylase TrmN6